MSKTKFTSFPFAVDGVWFNSKIADNCDSLPQILMLGEAFIQMNIEAVRELLGNPSTMTKAEILERLEEINENGTEMFLELAGA